MRGRKIVKFIPPGEMRTHPVMPFWGRFRKRKIKHVKLFFNDYCELNFRLWAMDHSNFDVDCQCDVCPNLMSDVEHKQRQSRV